MNPLLSAVLRDLAIEGDILEGLVEALPTVAWAAATPAVGWTIAHQIAHLAWTDEVALLAARAHDDKASWDEVVLQALADPTGFVDAMAAQGAAAPPEELLARWRAARPALAEALQTLSEGVRMPWFGPPMSATSMATARFMETWAHSLDVHEAAGVEPERSDRVRHIAHLGVRTRNFSFATHRLAAPDAEFAVRLRAPSGDEWSWGPGEATQSVTGSAYDFALLVTQRRHRDDLDLVANGSDADTWLDIAQAFAGPPGAGRSPS